MPERTARRRFEHLRSALHDLPRVRLAHLPTPLDHAPRAGVRLGGVDLFVKRDDATGLAFGGNKTRQLEYVLGHAVATGHDCVIHGAATQSNQSRQLVAAGAKLGLEVHLTPWIELDAASPQGNFLVTHLHQPILHPVAPGESIVEAKRELARTLRAQGRTPYTVGMGSSEALVLAAVAYVDAFVELTQQLGVADGARTLDRVVTASQGSTQAGLLVGARALGLDTRVLGVNPMTAAQEAYLPPERILEIAQETAERLGLQLALTQDDVENTTDYVGDGYGTVSDGAREAIGLLARTEGIVLDPIYSGKAFAGLIDRVRTGAIAPDERVAFLHTGGLPALFAHADRLADSMPRAPAAEDRS
ncbi:MAG: D-cysteine desulfhydrase family protein [Trueperaceae bacterium]